MITDIGKELRKLRIDRDELLQDMSRLIGKSPAFISAVERGSKSPPSGFEELVITAYDLDSDAANALRRAADRSRKAFIVEARTPLERDTAGLMARRMSAKMDGLSPDELERILAILRKGDGE